MSDGRLQRSVQHFALWAARQLALASLPSARPVAQACRAAIPAAGRIAASRAGIRPVHRDHQRQDHLGGPEYLAGCREVAVAHLVRHPVQVALRSAQHLALAEQQALHSAQQMVVALAGRDARPLAVHLRGRRADAAVLRVAVHREVARHEVLRRAVVAKHSARHLAEAAQRELAARIAEPAAVAEERHARAVEAARRAAAVAEPHAEEEVEEARPDAVVAAEAVQPDVEEVVAVQLSAAVRVQPSALLSAPPQVRPERSRTALAKPFPQVPRTPR